MLAGTVIPDGDRTPPSNGSIFAILLAPGPTSRKETGFAQV
jgi:hypothetical protein